MVTEVAGWILTNTKIDPLKVANAFGCTEEECWEYITNFNRALNEAEEEYRLGSEQRRLDLQEFVDSLNGKEIRRQVVLDKLYAAKRNPKAYSVSRLLQEAKAVSSPSDQLTQQDILRAKGKSIRELLNVTRLGNVSCPLHQDKTPSFQIKKNNTFTCYSCGEHGDVIDLYRLMHTCDFKTAVKALC